MTEDNKRKVQDEEAYEQMLDEQNKYDALDLNILDKRDITYDISIHDLLIGDLDVVIANLLSFKENYNNVNLWQEIDGEFMATIINKETNTDYYIRNITEL